MKKAILGKKLGMTQVFTSEGLVVPVTVVEAGPCYVSQVKTVEKDGYSAVQLAFDKVRQSLKNKAELGLYKKAGLDPTRYLKEFRLEGAENMHVGDTVTCAVFTEGELVDVTGTSKGHGTSGGIKKWNFHRHRMTHGNGPNHRHIGSSGSNTGVAKVFKGKKQYGRWGNETVTMQNLKVIRVDAERNLILVKGAIPGAKGSLVCIKDAVKA